MSSIALLIVVEEGMTNGVRGERIGTACNCR
jgi:hypothetical protein